MSNAIAVRQPPLGIRLVQALRKEPDILTMPDEALVAFRDAQNRKVASGLARLITGFPNRGATIGWQQLELPGRVLPVRVYRPRHHSKAALPVVIHVHGGGFVGTAVQCDWINSHVAAILPALVVSVEHRLVDRSTPLSAAADDGWDVLRHVVANWHDVDRARVAVMGESGGGAIAALAAIRARDAGLPLLRAQVLVNPCVDVTSTALDYPSMTEYAESPTLTRKRIEVFRELAIPQGSDPRAVSPLYADDLSGLPSTLIVVPVLDPIADHGRAYADKLRAADVPVQLTEHTEAGHAFLSMPGLVPQAKAARAQIIDFLRKQLAA